MAACTFIWFFCTITNERFFCTVRSNRRLRIYTLYSHACRLTTGSCEDRLLIAPFLRLVRRGERRHGEGEYKYTVCILGRGIRSPLDWWIVYCAVQKGDGEPHTEAAGVGLMVQHRWEKRSCWRAYFFHCSKLGAYISGIWKCVVRRSLSMQPVRFVCANFRAHLLWALFYGMKSRTLVKLLSIVLRGKMYDFVCDYVRDEVAKCRLCVGFF